MPEAMDSEDIIAHRLLLGDRQIVQSPYGKRGPRKEIDSAILRAVRRVERVPGLY